MASANGRFVMFSSTAANLPSASGSVGMYLRDRATGTTRVVSDPTASTWSDVWPKAVSDDGRYVLIVVRWVAYEEDQSVLLHDMTRRSSTVIAGLTGLEFGGSGDALMTPDARYITFVSDRAQAPFDSRERLYVHDRVRGTTSPVCLGGGAVTGAGCSYEQGGGERVLPVGISADGRNVLVRDRSDLFLRDRVAGTTRRLSRWFDGASLSADGRYVAFSSRARDVVPNDTNGQSDVFVHDVRTGTTTRASVGVEGAQSDNASYSAIIGAGGRYVVFVSLAGLVPGDANGAENIYVRDLAAHTTTLADLTLTGRPAVHGKRGSLSGLTMSSDGRVVGFTSPASDLVRGDSNHSVDVFARDRFAPPTPFGDFDGDGSADVLACQRSTGLLWLYPGTGNGLAPRKRIGAGWKAMTSVTRLGDFDGDGHEDVLARDGRTGTLWLYPGTGRGFAARVRLAASGWNAMRELTPVGDLDRDGRADLVAVQRSTGYLYLYPGRRRVLAPRRILSTWRSDFDELAGVGDLTGDGGVDLLARNPHTGELWLYPGLLVNGQAALGTPLRLGASGWTARRSIVGVGDFDRDGRADIVTVQPSRNVLRLYRGRLRSLWPGAVIGTGWTRDLRPVL